MGAQFIEWVRQLGLPVAALVGIAWFLHHEAWPFLKEQLAEARVERKDERDQFFTSLNSLATLTAEQYQRNSDLMNSFGEKLESVAGTVSRLTDVVERLELRLEGERGERGERGRRGRPGARAIG